MPDNRLRRTNRLRKSSEFHRVFKKGRKWVTPTLVFHVLPNGLEESRLGLAVSRRVGNAVRRNLVKRRIREVFRRKKKYLKQNCDLVVYPRKGIQEKQIEDYYQSFDILVAKVNRWREHPSSSRGDYE